MTAAAVLSSRAAAFERIKALVLDTLPSAASKRAYGQALDDFFRWCGVEAVGEFTKAAVNAYRASLEARNLSPSTINQRLSAIRKLAMEAADNGLMPPTVATAISRVKGAKQAGVRAGHWLTREQAENLLAAPNSTTNKGKRDRAVLAVLIGCGLRRREAAALTVEHIQLRDARWAIVDLIGKGGRVRTVPMPSWTKSAIDSWIAAAEIVSGIVFRSINKGGRVTGTSMTPRGIFEFVQKYGSEIGVAIGEIVCKELVHALHFIPAVGVPQGRDGGHIFRIPVLRKKFIHLRQPLFKRVLRVESVDDRFGSDAIADGQSMAMSRPWDRSRGGSGMPGPKAECGRA